MDWDFQISSLQTSSEKCTQKITSVLSLNIRGVGNEGKVSWLQELCRASGGILLVWNPSIIDVSEAVEGEFFLAIKGHLLGCNSEIEIVNVYGPHSTEKKVRFWDELGKLLNSKDMSWLVGGDFNEIARGSLKFHSGGKKFTRICENGLKFSKLDRFLISCKLADLWPNISATTLPKHLSDHCPILLRNTNRDFGPKPIRVFKEWLTIEGAEEVITKAWGLPVTSNNPDCIFRDKMKQVKKELKILSSTFHELESQILQHANAIEFWEQAAERKQLTDHERSTWMEEKK
ncbi:uncharacterized protein [Rutidosis leptorrhynchoides]|uniref:uncharacterized protein n=1 Tax=Rutidosis leptorrhynchoides TaxID=125765 RepID=UPI003A995BB5